MNFKRVSLLVILFFLIGGILQPKYHPEIKWNEISHGKFIIIYPEDLKKKALYSLNIAEKLYVEIKEFWKNDINGRVRILIHDSSDSFNEKSTFFPFNRIIISICPPEPYSLFGNYADHIKNVIRHGLNRIFVLNKGSRVLNFFRKYFGSNSVFFPTISIPEWTRSGLAAFEEIGSGTGTRFSSPEFELILNKIASENKFPPSGSLKSRSAKWPGPVTSDVFGSGLIKFLFESEKKDKIIKFVQNYASNPLPVEFRGLFKLSFLPMSKRFKMVFGKSLTNVLSEIESRSGKRDRINNNYKKLTDSGFVKQFVTYLSNGSLVFFAEDYKSYPGVFIMKKSDGKVSSLFRKKSVIGISYFKDENILYFSAIDSFRKYFDFADIYSFNLNEKRIVRLSRGERLSYPVRSGNKIYCIKNDSEGSYLVYLKTGDSKVHKISDRFTSLSGLSVSPDGRRIAVSVKGDNHNWKIGVFNIEGNIQGFIDYKGNRSFSPVWKSSDDLMFVTALEKRFGLILFNMRSGKTKMYNSDDLPSFKFFCITGTDSIVAPVLTGKGYDLMKIDLNTMASECFSCSLSESEMKPGNGSSSVPVENNYRSFRDFTPKYFTLTFREGGDELQAGLLASGFDLLKKHYFKVKYLSGVVSGRSNYYLNYIYNGLPGEFNLKYSNFSDLNRSDEMGKFFHVSKKFTASYTFPLSITSDGVFSIFTDIHLESNVDRFNKSFDDINTVFNGVRAGVSIRSTEIYYNSISENDGFNFNVIYSQEMKSLGSFSDSRMFSLEYSQFLPISDINVLALRFAFAESWGQYRRKFRLGGITGGTGQSYSNERLFGLLRGYPSGYFSGTTGFSLNLEYRMLITRIERPFLIFKSIESIYASLFLDSGQVCGERMGLDPVISAGGELNLVLYLGSLKYVVTGGVAFGINPERSPVFYFRIGSSF